MHLRGVLSRQRHLRRLVRDETPGHRARSDSCTADHSADVGPGALPCPPRLERQRIWVADCACVSPLLERWRAVRMTTARGARPVDGNSCHRGAQGAAPKQGSRFAWPQGIPAIAMKVACGSCAKYRQVMNANAAVSTTPLKRVSTSVSGSSVTMLRAREISNGWRRRYLGARCRRDVTRTCATARMVRLSWYRRGPCCRCSHEVLAPFHPVARSRPSVVFGDGRCCDPTLATLLRREPRSERYECWPR